MAKVKESSGISLADLHPNYLLSIKKKLNTSHNFSLLLGYICRKVLDEGDNSVSAREICEKLIPSRAYVYDLLESLIFLKLGKKIKKTNSEVVYIFQTEEIRSISELVKHSLKFHNSKNGGVK